jgi:hypothetical protein
VINEKKAIAEGYVEVTPAKTLSTDRRNNRMDCDVSLSHYKAARRCTQEPKACEQAKGI